MSELSAAHTPTMSLAMSIAISLAWLKSLLKHFHSHSPKSAHSLSGVGISLNEPAVFQTETGNRGFRKRPTASVIENNVFAHFLAGANKIFAE